MPHNPKIIQKRNQRIKERFRYHVKKNPKWSIVAILEEVADEFFLSPITVSNIMRADYPKIPTAKTIRKYASEFLIDEN